MYRLLVLNICGNYLVVGSVLIQFLIGLILYVVFGFSSSDMWYFVMYRLVSLDSIFRLCYSNCVVDDSVVSSENMLMFRNVNCWRMYSGYGCSFFICCRYNVQLINLKEIMVISRKKVCELVCMVVLVQRELWRKVGGLLYCNGMCFFKWYQ